MSPADRLRARDSNGPPADSKARAPARLALAALAAVLLLASARGAVAQKPPAQDPAEAAPAGAEPQSDTTAETIAPESTAPEATAAAADDAGAAAPEAAPAARAPTASKAAVGYANTLKKAIVLETQVQDFERSTLGKEDPATLEGYRKARRERIEKDKEFTQVSKTFSLTGMIVPSAAGANISRDAHAVLALLQRTYEGSRDKKPLEQYMELNRTFLKAADWAVRDKAVKLRDEIVQRESAYKELVLQAHDVVAGTAGDDVVAAMKAKLVEIAPEEAAGPQTDLAALVLRDQAMRDDVVKELTSILTAPAEAAPAPRPADALTPEVNNLQVELLQKGNLENVVAEHEHVLSELDKVDAAIESKPSTDLVAQKTELVTRREELELQWYQTVPDPETYAQLVATQDELTRRLMQDLGPAGVLYGPRLDDVERLAAQPVTAPLQQWKVLEQQRDLLASLDAAKPALDPLAGLTPPDSLIMPVAKTVPFKPKLAAKAVPKPHPKPKAHAKAPKKAKPWVNPNTAPHKKKGGHGHGHGMSPY